MKTNYVEITMAPHMKFKPKLFKDGDMWCALYGDNMMDGIVGFGKTPNKALKAFDKSFDEDFNRELDI